MRASTAMPHANSNRNAKRNERDVGPPQKVKSTHDAEGSGACAHRSCNRNKRRIARQAQSSRDHQAAPPPPASTRPRRSAAAAEKKCQCSCTVTRLRRQAAAAIAKQQRRHEEELHLFTGKGRGRRGSASLRRADAAQVCNDVGFVEVDGQCECSPAPAARQIVSERW